MQVKDLKAARKHRFPMLLSTEEIPGISLSLSLSHGSRPSDSVGLSIARKRLSGIAGDNFRQLLRLNGSPLSGTVTESAGMPGIHRIPIGGIEPADDTGDRSEPALP